MRLRYLHLENYPPISKTRVCFASGSPMGRECAIRFVVGVNGSGKSNLLRAVAEVFLSLADLRVPAFPVTLVYELGLRGSSSHRTLLLHCPGGRSRASLWIHERFSFDDSNGEEAIEACIEQLALMGKPSLSGFTALIDIGRWPLRDSSPPQIALPSAVLAYTTGELRPWRSVWSRNQNAEGRERPDSDSNGEERPAGWTVEQELALLAARPSFEATRAVDIRVATVEAEAFRRPLLLDATLLKCALLAVALPDSFTEPAEQPRQGAAAATAAQRLLPYANSSGFKEILERGGWHHLVCVTFRSRLQAAQWDQKLRETAHDWWLCATEVIAEPHPAEARRTLVFDLNGSFKAQPQSFASSASSEIQTCTTNGEALWHLLGGAKNATAFDLFTRLLELKQAGLFDDVLLRLRKHAVPTAEDKDIKKDVGVLRFEELSDGEQMFMGRMALFHLLNGRHDSLLLLDEPETHFNDLWKRDVASVVDDALAKTSADVLIATHASLMLTDALKEELIVLERTPTDRDAGPEESSIRILDSQTHTFGATGDHPLRDIFGAPDTVGRRASRLLEVLIATAQFSSEVEAHWSSDAFWSDDLIERILRVANVTESGLAHSDVLEYLDRFAQFGAHFGVEQPMTMKALLEAFIRQTGPGYFQVELKRAWRRTSEEKSRAS